MRLILSDFLEQISLEIEIGNFQSAKLCGDVFFIKNICLLAQIYEHLVGERREQGWQGKHQEKEKLTN